LPSRTKSSRPAKSRSYATLIENLPGMVYRCRNDCNWSMEFVSDGCRALTGYTPEDLIDNQKLAFSEVIHLEDRQGQWQQIQSSLRSKQPYLREYRFRTAEGKERWAWEWPSPKALSKRMKVRSGWLVSREKEPRSALPSP
jgi:PAS domain S-box-containing protein